MKENSTSDAQASTTTPPQLHDLPDWLNSFANLLLGELAAFNQNAHNLKRNTLRCVDRVCELEEKIAEMEDHITALEEKGPDALWTIHDVTDHLNVCKRTVETQISLGNITPIWVGHSRRFTPESIDAYKRQATGNKPA